MLDDGTIYWSVWAPNAESVQLVLMAEDGSRCEVPMERELSGEFVQQLDCLGEGQRYGFRVNGGPLRPDPASRWQPEGVHRPSAVFCPEHFFWTDQAWHGVPRDQLVIYELHVGTFTPEGTFDAIIPRLESLRELGITAIELMPVAQFPGSRNWGYDGVHPFAVQNSYGGPLGLQNLINACHQIGLAVILDVVYNHVGPEGNYLGEFGPYFTDHYHTPWGSAINFDQPGCDGVRAFVLENVRYWVRDFHVDGLRLDAVHAIFDSSPHHILLAIKETAAHEADQLGWPVHVIAESDQNDVRLLDPPETGCGWVDAWETDGGATAAPSIGGKPAPSISGGCGLGAVWNDDFHHAVHALLTGERQGYYADYGQPEQLVKALNQTFVYDGCHSDYRGRCYGTEVKDRAGDHFVVSIQNHDQVGNRAWGDRFGTLLSPAQQRLAAGLLLLSPHVPLLFMGEEYGETRMFPFFCSFEDHELAEAVRKGRREEFDKFGWGKDLPDPQAELIFGLAQLSWTWEAGSRQAGLRRLYHDLLDARRRWPALKDFRTRRADLLPGTNGPGVLRLVRGGHRPEEKDALVAYFNLGKEPQPLPDTGETGCCCSMCLLSSEDGSYGGGRTHAYPLDMLLPFEFQVYGPCSWEAL
ncbi:MAG: malto-oligosyltrehalose trehalohydrolase [Planctomycetaceae bacterium]|nr:malto-oligosyltrehalose trehalohydrolase [Planctomycetaceae bacterium]